MPQAQTMLVQRLFVKHQGVIKAFILSLQPQLAEAEDVLQETFITVTQKAAAFEEGTNFVAWACTIARFKLLEARRRAARREAATALSIEALEALSDDAPEPAFFEARLAAVRHCLEDPAPRARQIVQLRYHGGQSCEAIGQQVGWQPAAIRVALAKARVALRQCVSRQLQRAT